MYEGNRQCRRQGTGNPPLCDDHADELDDDVDPIVAAVIDRVVTDPRARRIIDSLGGLVDRFGDAIDRMPAPDAEGRRPINGESARPHRPPRPAPRPRPTPREDPRVILGIPAGAKVSKDFVKKRHRELAAIIHPDRGGSNEAMQRLNRARDDLLASL